MANYNNATKNPPWQQQSNLGINLQGQQQGVLNAGLLQYPQNALLQAQQLIQQNTASSLVYGNTVSTNQQQQYGNTANTGYNHMAAASNVTYPTRHLNSTAFATSTPNVLNPVATGQGILGAAQVPQGQGLLGTSPATFPKQRVFTGTITKRQDNFGFVDEDVFFQVDVCKGSNPRLGDKVLVEAAYNPSMPFKWNATRIQVLPMDKNKNQGLGYNRFSNGSSRYSPPANDDYKRRNNTGGDSNRRPTGFSNRRSSPERSAPSDRKRRFDDTTTSSSRSARSPKKEDKERDRSTERDSVSTRRSRSSSPKRRRVRPTPRYAVTVPKFALDLAQADLLELRRRYQNMYIPSDFFISSSVWLEAFPPDRPFSLQHPCSFHILSKEVEPYLPNTAELDPPDVDYLFSAKVMLLSMPKLEEVLKKCVTPGEELDKEHKSCVHPSRLIHFLVGMRGKSETMAIGGPWSESLDGPAPDRDPAVLIKTAIRTTKALTGIDLSKCTKWFKFLELYYRRGETTHKGKPIAARVETVVIYVPDVWNCVPTQLEWDGLTVNYQKMFNAKTTKPVEETAKSTEDDKDTTMDVDTSVLKREPTHYSLLDIKNMKVQDLREELEARSLPCKGLKSQLTARLAKALKSEQSEDDAKGEIEEAEEEEKEEEKREEKKEDGEKKEGDGEKKEKDEEMTEKEKQRLERKYTLPDAPSILVHPSTTAKSGKFNCEVMSLSLLLDYRIDDAKEHSFEVACFAELFNEMLMRDFGFQIFKAIHNAPEPVKEEKEDKKEKSKKDEDKSNAEEKEVKEDTAEKDDEKEEDDSEKGETKDSDKKDKELEKKIKKEDKKDGAKKDDKKEDKKSSKDERDRKRAEDREKRREKEKEKMYTENAFLLLCCVYFDTTHVGYLYDKDLEDLLLTLGLSLSRSQVKKLVQKVLTRDTFYYRKLTDKPLVEGTEQTTATEIKLDIELLKQLIEGNKKFLPVFSDPAGTVGKSPKKGKAAAGGDSQLVLYQGSYVDIGNMQASLEKSDGARVSTEKALTKLRAEHASLQQSAAKLKEKLAATTSQLEATSAELTETQTRRAAATETKEELYKVVESIYKLSAEVVDKARTVEVKEEVLEEVKEEEEPVEDGEETEVKEENVKEEDEEKMDE